MVGAAVGRRMEELDATFLATLDGYIRGASDKGAADVAGGAWRGEGGGPVGVL